MTFCFDIQFTFQISSGSVLPQLDILQLPARARNLITGIAFKINRAKWQVAA